VMGTMPLLLQMKEDPDGLPRLSDLVGDFVRSNNESLIAVATPKKGTNFSKGVAITSILHTDEHSHMEPVRYGSGSGFFRTLLAPHAPGPTVLSRLWGGIAAFMRTPIRWLRTLFVSDLAKASQVLLYMRTLEGTLRMRLGREWRTGYQRSLASYSVPAVTMVNQDGQQVSLPELLDSDQPVMLNFIFTSCTAICPAMSAIFTSVQNELGSDSARLRMVSISIDPEYDTPEALNAYARRFDAGPQWQFLTGSLDDSIAVQKAFDADRGDKMNHAPLTLFRASPEAQWVRYEGFATAAELVKECRNML